MTEAVDEPVQELMWETREAPGKGTAESNLRCPNVGVSLCLPPRTGQCRAQRLCGEFCPAESPRSDRYVGKSELHVSCCKQTIGPSPDSYKIAVWCLGRRLRTPPFPWPPEVRRLIATKSLESGLTHSKQRAGFISNRDKMRVLRFANGPQGAAPRRLDRPASSRYSGYRIAQ